MYLWKTAGKMWKSHALPFWKSNFGKIFSTNGTKLQRGTTLHARVLSVPEETLQGQSDKYRLKDRFCPLAMEYGYGEKGLWPARG
jgi:hypothetical protein